MPAAFLLDLDGTLYTDTGAVPGGPELIATLRSRQIPFRCLTNTTSLSRNGLVTKLAGLGYQISPAEIVTPARAATLLCRARRLRRVLALSPAASLEDLGELEFAAPGEGCDAVVVGDLGESWSFELLQHAFGQLQAGADLIALSKDRYSVRRGQLRLDAGPFVAALEYASGRHATVVGKPSPDFFRLAVDSMAILPGDGIREVAMVGDDVWSDVRGAQQAGLQGWLVKTGKYREAAVAESGVKPDRLLGSVVEALDGER